MARQLSCVVLEWTNGDDFAHCFSSEDYCLNLTREDCTRSGDLDTQEQDDNNNIHRCVLRVGCLFWEKPVDLKMQMEMKTVGTVVIVDPKTGLQLRRKRLL
ncbi:hypothetical protein Bbelb_066960 [Branchiostoma belcheri]|nr:hypothetical protein Bbelb_066960 [Branchiostoma belcheri]